jgi:DNA-binding cell septation regulator SpoVG
MQITQVEIRRCRNPVLKAFVTIEFDTVVSIRGVKLVQTADGLAVTMSPEKSSAERIWKMLWADPKMRADIEAAILKAYLEDGGVEEAGVPAPIEPSPGPLAAEEKRELPRADGPMLDSDLPRPLKPPEDRQGGSGS